ncbi:MAG: hypothetical protein RL264_61 [Bacteroidota bacterium]
MQASEAKVQQAFGKSGAGDLNIQIWNYLNKGTYEESDRDDFNLKIVEEVLNNLIQFETELHKIKKRNARTTKHRI